MSMLLCCPDIRCFCHIEVKSLQLRRLHRKLGCLSDNALCTLSGVILAGGEIPSRLGAMPSPVDLLAAEVELKVLCA